MTFNIEDVTVVESSCGFRYAGTEGFSALARSDNVIVEVMWEQGGVVEVTNR
jgi:hypothetical protein